MFNLPPLFKSVVIIGAAGRFGRLFRDLIAATGADLICFDLAEVPNCILADAEQPDERMMEAIGASDLVLICLPDQVSNRALPTILRLGGSNSLFVESRSVMSGRSKDVSGHRANIICINPLFAPDIGFRGRSVAVIGSVQAPTGQRFIQLLQSWGAQIVEMREDEHDRLAAVTQALVHTNIIGFAIALHRTLFQPRNGAEPPPSALMRMLAARILMSEPSTYWAIQIDNPFANDARMNLMSSLDELRVAFEERDRDKFQSLWSEGLSALGGDAKFLASECAEIFGDIDTRPR
ncbi:MULTISPECIES: hypothetical protein [unclassified Bradyrhizobium]|uniref:hypothetical protein n=1 Tax=unclassified Bradyrhizobium TaxID=2631580 RepID=UPI002916DA07|nr:MULTISPECIES: hypothetical protein [unclassified Bradyrhizobium]